MQSHMWSHNDVRGTLIYPDLPVVPAVPGPTLVVFGSAPPSPLLAVVVVVAAEVLPKPPSPPCKKMVKSERLELCSTNI